MLYNVMIVFAAQVNLNNSGVGLWIYPQLSRKKYYGYLKHFSVNSNQ